MWTFLIGRSRTTTLRWSVVLISYAATWRMADIPFVLRSSQTKPFFPSQGYGLLTKTYSNLFYETDYDATGFKSFQRSVWISPVTMFVLGQYPK